MRSGGSGTALLKQTWDGLLDLVYPPRCLVCERYNRPALCEECARTFQPIPEPACMVCGRPRDENEKTGDCRYCGFAEQNGGWGFESARAAAVFQGALREAIHCLKYRSAESLGEPLGAYLANRCVVEGLLPDGGIDLIVPVPMHPARQRARGFNQAHLLASPLADMLGVPLLPGVLARVRKTPPQVGLTSEARRRNLTDAFAVPDAAVVRDRRALLVDDVFTTGSTVAACARTLKQGGAASVIVVTLAAGG